LRVEGEENVYKTIEITGIDDIFKVIISSSVINSFKGKEV